MEHLPLILLYIRTIGYAALATAMVYVLLVVKTELQLQGTRERLFNVIHGSSAVFFYAMSITSLLNMSKYVHPPSTATLFIMNWIFTPLIIICTVAAWWFCVAHTRRDIYIQRTLSTLL